MYKLTFEVQLYRDLTDEEFDILSGCILAQCESINVDGQEVGIGYIIGTDEIDLVEE